MEMSLSKLVRKKYSRALIFPIILLVAAAVILYFNWWYVISFFYGPAKATGVLDAEAKYEQNDAYVTLDADVVYDSGYYVETVTTTDGKVTNRKNTSFYAYAQYDEGGFLLIEVPYSYYTGEFEYENLDLTGRLRLPDPELTIFEDFAKDLADELNYYYNAGLTQEEILNEYMGYVYLDTTVNSLFYDAVIGLCGVLILLGLILLIRDIMLMANPRLHKVYKVLAKYGDKERTEDLLQRELDDDRYLIARSGNNFVLKSFIISTTDGIQIRRTEDLIWAYKHNVTRNGVTTYYIQLRFKEGVKNLRITVKGQTVSDEFMSNIAAKLPVITGYSKEYKTMYEKNYPEFLNMWQQYKNTFVQTGYEQAYQNIGQ